MDTNSVEKAGGESVPAMLTDTSCKTMGRDQMYTVTHHYLTMDDNDGTVVEREQQTATEAVDIADIVNAMVNAPGGRSGTTISLTVSLNDSTSL
jgi:hypothetical protein